MRIKTMQNVSTAKSSKTSEALGGFEPPISYLRDKRINLCYRAMLHREVSRSTFTDTVMVKKPKGPMRIKTMQNVSTAKYSKIKRPLGRFEPPISCLRDKRIPTMLESRNKERKQK